MADTKYIESLDVDTLEALEKALNNDNGDTALIDKAFEKAPKLTEEVTIYKAFEHSDELENGATFKVNGPLSGTTSQPEERDDTTILEITVPSGLKAIAVPGGYIFGRGLTLDAAGFDGYVVPTLVVDNETPTEVKLTVWPTRPGITEFYNENHSKEDGRFTSGKNGSSGGSVGGEAEKTPEELKAIRRKKIIKRVAIGVAAVAVVAGLAFLGYKKAPGSFDWSANAKHSRNLEDTKAEGGERLQSAIHKASADIIAGRNVDRNVRDLAILADNRFVHQDDMNAYMHNLQKNKYTEDEKAHLWNFGGLFRQKEKHKMLTPEQHSDAEGVANTTKGPFRFSRFLRFGGSRLSREDMDTLNAMDRIIKKNGLPRDTVLFRGQPSTEKEYQRLLRARPGTVVEDNAHLYVGLTEERARPHFADDSRKGVGSKYTEGRDRPVLFEIEAPKGLPAVQSPWGLGLQNRKVPLPAEVVRKLPVGKRLRRKLSNTNVRLPLIDKWNKEELVLRRKQRLTVLRQHVRPDGTLVVRVRAEQD